MNPKHVTYTGMLIIAVVGFAGCVKSANQATTNATSQASDEARIHGEWWCDEHGVPEEICAQCKTDLAADFKAKGDWCAKHDRPDSQCFICHPEKEAEFAALYEAKFGKKPPKPAAEGEAHEQPDHDQRKS